MPGVKGLRFIQLAKETTAGTTNGTATALWRGLGTIEDKRVVSFPDEDIGYLAKSDRTYIAKFEGGIVFDPVPATFDQIGYLFAAGIQNITTGTADGAGTDKIYDYVMPTTQQQLPKTFTIQGGDDNQAEQMEYSFVDTITLTGNAGEALMMGATWVGREVTNATKTAGIALPTVEDILFSKGSLYIDNAGGTIGATQVTQTLISMSLSIKTGITPVWTADGNLYFTFIKGVVPEVTLSLTYEHNASAVAEKTNWRNQTARLIQLKFLGNANTTAGTSYGNHTLVVNLAGKYETWSKIGDNNGNDIVTATFRARYDATAARFAEFIVVNELAALP